MRHIICRFTSAGYLQAGLLEIYDNHFNTAASKLMNAARRYLPYVRHRYLEWLL